MNHQFNDNELEEFIKQFDRELLDDASQIELPESLSSKRLFEKYNISDLTQNTPAKKYRMNRQWMGLAASAACFVLIFMGYARLAQLGADYATPEQAKFAQSEEGETRPSLDKAVSGSYTAVREAITKLNSRQTTNKYMMESGGGAAVPSPPAAAPEAAPNFTTGMADSLRKDVYTTNVQVEGIDESDIVKTDGKYLYHARYDDSNGQSEVAIVSASDLKLVTTIPLGSNTSTELYLYNDRLVVIDSVPAKEAQDLTDEIRYTLGELAPIEQAPSSSAAEDLLIAPSFVGKMMPMQNTMTRAAVYDIKDKSHPKQVNSLVQDGRYISSRLQGDQLYLVTNKTSSYEMPYDFMPAREIIPAIAQNNQVGLIKAEDIILSPYMQNANYAVVSAVNLSSNNVNTKAVLGMVDEIVMSEKSLLLTSGIYSYNPQGRSQQSTGIVKFDLNQGTLSFKADTLVEGYIDSQFAIDEYQGDLRVATTSFREGTSQSNVYVYDESLKQIGSVENLAPGEVIHSVRFSGEVAYVVTFKQIDPLFVIDLKDPTKPVVKGELKIPGFSEYLHPIGDGKLIGLGVNTIQDRNGAVIQDGLKLSLFDVNNPSDPVEKAKLEIGNMGSNTEALSNHKAFMYYPAKGLFGFPVDIYTAKSGRYGDTTSAFNGFVVFKIKKDGFELVGKVPSNNEQQGIEKFDYSNVISRGVYIGDKLYTVSNGKLMTYSLKSFSKLDELVYH